MLRHIAFNEIFTVLILIGLICIAIAKLLAPKRFNDFILVLGNYQYLRIYSREQKFFDRFDALLFTNLIISLTIFAYIGYQIVHDTNIISINLLFKLAFGIAVFILIKVLIERLIGSLFEIDSVVDQYLFQKISYKNYLGIVMVPINALLLYNLNPSLNLIWGIVIFILIVNIIGLTNLYKTNQSLLKRNIFYFILYLCALEIAPYIILYKVFIAK